MGIPVFLSYPQPYLKSQEKFIKNVIKYLRERGLETKTLGVTDYDMNAPLVAIRRLMSESNGLLTVAFRRAYIAKGVGKPDTDIPNMKQYDISDKWITSMYCHIEPAMAFQIGLPILIFRESGVIADGILEKGVTGLYMPEFNLDLDESIEEYFKGDEWKQVIGAWENHVKNIYYNRKSTSTSY